MAASTHAMTLTPSAHDLSKASLVDPAVDELTEDGSSATSFPIANPDKPQAACVLLLDTSRSMRGAPIRALQQGLEAYREYLANDPEARLIVETCVIAFSDEAKVVHPFSDVGNLPKVELAAGGWTSMGAAIDLGISQIEERKAFYRAEGVDYYRPFLVLITDGAPTDLKGEGRFADCAAKLQQGAKDRKFIPLLFGTGNANFEKLKQLGGESAVVAGIDGARFGEFFQWLSKSVSGLKDSKPGQVVTFADPTVPTPDQPNPFAFEV
jgi:uncharacterized protein YegL